MFRSIVTRGSKAISATTFRQTTPSLQATALRCFSTDDPSDAQRLKGTCKWFDVKKGFGFIVPNDGGDDVFVHQSSIYAPGFRSLGENEVVEYNLFQDDRGRNTAVDVTGPEGDYVQGAPRQTRDDYNSFPDNSGY